MEPTIVLYWPAIIVSVVVAFAIGGIWYGPLFGKVWAKASGFPDGQKPSGAEIARGSLINIFGTFLMVFVLAHDIGAWRPSSWGLGPDKAPHFYGFFAGMFLWLGFVVPILLNSVAYERKSWKVFGINAAYQFIAMQAMGLILAYWR